MSYNSPVSTDLHNELYTCSDQINYFANPAVFFPYLINKRTNEVLIPYFLAVNEYGFVHESNSFCSEATQNVFLNSANCPER